MSSSENVCAFSADGFSLLDVFTASGTGSSCVSDTGSFSVS